MLSPKSTTRLLRRSGKNVRLRSRLETRPRRSFSRGSNGSCRTKGPGEVAPHWLERNPPISVVWGAMSGVMESCPHCRTPYGATFLGLSSGLGSSQYECSRCQGRFSSCRTEWRDQGSLARLRYGIMSVVYVAVLGGGSGIVTKAAWQNLKNGPTDSVAPDGAPFWAGAIVGGLMVLSLQIWRVRRSAQRTAEANSVVMRASFVSPHTNLQMIAVGVLLAAVISSALVGFLIH